MIACAEEFPEHVAIPRGCRVDLEALLRDHKVALDVVDERVMGSPLSLRFHGKLTEVQESAARALLGSRYGRLRRSAGRRQDGHRHVPHRVPSV